MRRTRMGWSCLILTTLLAHLATAFIQVIPHNNVKCNSPLEASYLNSPPSSDPKYFQIGDSVQKRDGGSASTPQWFTQIQFPDAPVSNDTVHNVSGNIIVYWKVPNLGNHCRVVFLDRYTQAWFGTVGNDPPQVEGNIIANFGHGGCNAVPIKYGQDVAITSCCGAACQNLAAANPGLYRRGDEGEDEYVPDGWNTPDGEPIWEEEEDVDEKPPKLAARSSWDGSRKEIDERDEGNTGTSGRRKSSRSLDSRSVSRQGESVDLWEREINQGATELWPRAHPRAFTSRDPADYGRALDANSHISPRDDSPDFDTSNCNVVSQSPPYSSAGYQEAMTAAQECGNEKCSIDVSFSLETGTAMTSSTSNTVTNTLGQSMTISRGGGAVSVAETTSHKTATAISNRIGRTVDEKTKIIVKNTVGMIWGTLAFVAFTQTYVCYDVKINCGGSSGDSDPITMCYPAYTSDNTTVQGDLKIVVIN